MRLIDRLTDILVALAGLQAVVSLPGALYGSGSAVSLDVIVVAGALICLALRGSSDALAYGVSLAILVGLSAYMYASYVRVAHGGGLGAVAAIIGAALYVVASAASVGRLYVLVREAQARAEAEARAQAEAESEEQE